MVYSGLDNDEHKFLQGWENSKSKKKQLSERNKMEIEELQKFKVPIRLPLKYHPPPSIDNSLTCFVIS